MHDARASFPNCYGKIKGTVRPLCCPVEMQRVVYNDRKRVNALKFQSTATPNDSIGNLFVPAEDRSHNSGMLAETKVHLIILYTKVQLTHFVIHLYLIHFTNHNSSHSHSPYLVLLILHRISTSFSLSCF